MGAQKYGAFCSITSAVAEANNIYLKSRELILIMNYIQESADSGQKAVLKANNKQLQQKKIQQEVSSSSCSST